MHRPGGSGTPPRELGYLTYGLRRGSVEIFNGRIIGYDTIAGALRSDTDFSDYHVYDVTRRIPVRAGFAAPWFNEPGMGIQYKLPAGVSDLIKAGYLRAIT
jgi:hypothetical protein